jgi:putative sterol carrier protein
VIHTPAEAWEGIAAGKIDGQQAYMKGNYTVEGDLSLLLRMSSRLPI